MESKKIHLQREIEKVKKRILALGAEVEESVILSIRALENRDIELARSIQAKDDEIDKKEVELEEECLKILALHQPVAIDLRFIVATMKMNNDLERIGDLSFNIALRVEKISKYKKVEIPRDLVHMAEKSKEMLSMSLDALINLNIDLASEVLIKDDEVDDDKKKLYERYQKKMQVNPDKMKSYIRLLDIVSDLERIADHATNLAEDVIYMVEGRIVRHRDHGDFAEDDV
jgi:phosphate transport system protein